MRGSNHIGFEFRMPNSGGNMKRIFSHRIFGMVIALIIAAGSALCAEAADSTCGTCIESLTVTSDGEFTQLVVSAGADIDTGSVAANNILLYCSDADINSEKRLMSAARVTADGTKLNLWYKGILESGKSYTAVFSEVCTTGGIPLRNLEIADNTAEITDYNTDIGALYGKSSKVVCNRTFYGNDKEVYSVSASQDNPEYIILSTDGDAESLGFYTYTYGKGMINGDFAVSLSADGTNYTTAKLSTKAVNSSDRLGVSWITSRYVSVTYENMPTDIRYIKISYPDVTYSQSTPACAAIGDIAVRCTDSLMHLDTRGAADASRILPIRLKNPISGLNKTDFSVSGGVGVTDIDISADGRLVNLYLSDALSAATGYAVMLNGHNDTVLPKDRYFGFSTVLSTQSEDYTYGNVNIGGGGMITGLVFSENDPDLLYCRTDVGGIFRRDYDGDRWIPLNDIFDIDRSTHYAINGICTDPNNSDVIYAACGGRWYASGRIYKSSDRGETWQPLNLTPIFVGSEGRLDGECIAVDPNDSNTVYVGTPYQGLYVSRDAGSTWSRYADSVIPWCDVPKSNAEYSEYNANEKNFGIRSIYFFNGNVYVGYYDRGVYMSSDNGVTWQLMNGSPTRPRHMTDYLGKLYVTCYTDEDNGFSDGVYAYDSAADEWISDSPVPSVKFGGITKTLNGTDNILIAGTDEKIYYKVNDGSWNCILEGVNNRQRYDISEHMSWAEANSGTTGNGIIGRPSGAMAARPVCRDGKVELWIGDGWTMWCNSDALNLNSLFAAECAGIEETVVNCVSAPAGGETVLLSGIYDYAGYRHTDIGGQALYPYRIYRNTQKTSTYWAVSMTSFDYCSKNTNYMAYFTDTYRNGEALTNAGSYGVPALSDDNGKTWYSLNWTASDDYYSGCVAVGAEVLSDGYPSVVIIPKSSGKKDAETGLIPTAKALVTKDFGRTWSEVSGLPDNLLAGSSQKHRNIIASDRVNGSRFYVYDKSKGEFYYSTDGGESFSKSSGFKTEPQDTTIGNWSMNNDIEANPNVEGDVIFCAGNRGVFRTKDGGENIYRIDGIENAEGVAFGANVLGTDTASVFVLAELDGRRGLYRSDDDMKTWIYVDCPQNGLGCTPTCIEGDKRKFGRVYVGTLGRGIMYFDSESAEPYEPEYCRIEFVSDGSDVGWIKTGGDVKRMYDGVFSGQRGLINKSAENKSGSLLIDLNRTSVVTADGESVRLNGYPESLKFGVRYYGSGAQAENSLIYTSADGENWTCAGKFADFMTKKSTDYIVTVGENEYADKRRDTFSSVIYIQLGNNVVLPDTKYIRLNMNISLQNSAVGIIYPSVVYNQLIPDYEISDECFEYGDDETVLVGGAAKFNGSGNLSKTDFCVVTAAYSDDGVLIDVKAENFLNVRKGASRPFSHKLNFGGTGMIKIFMFDSINNIIPLSESKILEVKKELQ